MKKTVKIQLTQMRHVSGSYLYTGGLYQELVLKFILGDFMAIFSLKKRSQKAAQ